MVLISKAAKRDIPIPKCLVGCLREAKETSRSAYVIADSKGEPLATSQFQRGWKYVVVWSTKPRNYYKYVNGQSIKYKVTSTLGMTQKKQLKIKYLQKRDDLPDRHHEVGAMEEKRHSDDRYGYEQPVPVSGKELRAPSDWVITKAVDIVANNNSFHPIIDFLEGLIWDGTPRISHMLTHFFGAEDQKYTGEIMKMHMILSFAKPNL